MSSCGFPGDTATLTRGMDLCGGMSRSLSLLSLSLSISRFLSLSRACARARSLCGMALQEDVAEYDRKEGEGVRKTTHAAYTRLD